MVAPDRIPSNSAATTSPGPLLPRKRYRRDPHADVNEVGTVLEPRISWRVVDDEDEIAGRSGNSHIRPRAPDMRTDEGERISVPEDLLGIDVRAQGSNLPLVPGNLRSKTRAGPRPGTLLL